MLTLVNAETESGKAPSAETADPETQAAPTLPPSSPKKPPTSAVPQFRPSGTIYASKFAAPPPHSFEEIDWDAPCYRCHHQRRMHADRGDQHPPALGLCMEGTCRCPHFIHSERFQPTDSAPDSTAPTNRQPPPKYRQSRKRKPRH